MVKYRKENGLAVVDTRAEHGLQKGFYASIQRFFIQVISPFPPATPKKLKSMQIPCIFPAFYILFTTSSSKCKPSIYVPQTIPSPPFNK